MQYLGSLLAPSDREERITPRDRDRAYHQLVQFLRSWAYTVDRRGVLRFLAWAASAASVFPATAGDEHQRMASVLTTSSRVDAQTLEHIEAVLWHCRRQDHALGPQAVLTTVLAQRDLTRALVPDCPDALQPRMLSVLSEASRQAGWLSFDLKQFPDRLSTVTRREDDALLGAYWRTGWGTRVRVLRERILREHCPGNPLCGAWPPAVDIVNRSHRRVTVALK